MNDMAKNLLLWVVIAVVLIAVFQSFNPHGTTSSDLSYSDFMQQVENNAVGQVTISADHAGDDRRQAKDGTPFANRRAAGRQPDRSRPCARTVCR